MNRMPFYVTSAPSSCLCCIGQRFSRTHLLSLLQSGLLLQSTSPQFAYSLPVHAHSLMFPILSRNCSFLILFINLTCTSFNRSTEPTAFFLQVFFNAQPIHPQLNKDKQRPVNELIPSVIAYSGGLVEFSVDMGTEVRSFISQEHVLIRESSMLLGS